MHINIICVLWQTDAHQYNLCIMTDWYTSIQLCIMTDWYTSIQSVYYDRLIHINIICVLWQTDTHQYNLCVMTDWYTSVCTMAHWYMPIHRTLLFSSNSLLLSLQCSFGTQTTLHLHSRFTPVGLPHCSTLFADGISSIATVSVWHHKLSYSCWTSLGIIW
jgi:hypothetical protein